MADKDTEDSFVKVQGNEIFFYCEVSDVTVLEFNMKLRQVAKEHDRITVYIHSNGGDLWAGLSAMDHIRKCQSHVTTVADGICASAATMMLLAGDERRMHQHSYVLIHQVNTDGSWEKYSDLKEQVGNYDRFMKNFKKIYEKYTNIPSGVLDKLFMKDIYWDYRKCVKYGVVATHE
jgi:ATP-dependent protease ClpP protease subunit